MVVFRSRWLIRVLYFLAIPGLPRWLGRFRCLTSDLPAITALEYVMVQAFGRRSYPDKGLLEMLSPAIKLDSLESSMLSLQKTGFSPGTTNLELALVCLRLWHLNPNMLVIAQWEVCYCLWSISPDQFRQTSEKIVCLWPDSSYYATVHVKRATANEIHSRGLDPDLGLELAHPDMAARAQLILWRLGIRPGLLVVDLPFDRESVQWWTRSAVLWAPREIAGRIQHLLWGWVSFSSSH
jgi:hypothetical protein